MASPTAIAILGAILAMAALQYRLFESYYLPYGTAVPVPSGHGPHVGPNPDPSNTSLRASSGKLTKIYERVDEGDEALLSSPESVIFNEDGDIFIINEGAKLITLTDIRATDEPYIMTAKTKEVADLGVGRPLAGKFDKHACLYFADIIMGLARICLNDPTGGSQPRLPHVELLASRVKLANGAWSPINYADDLDIGPETGHIYFSDATDARPVRDVKTGRWDVLYPSKVEVIRSTMSGRVLRYKPETGETDVLVTGVSFANGVAVDKDENYVLYVSTFDRAVMKYYLKGEKAGQIERLLDQFPGILDGIDCSFQSGRCYVAIPSTIPPVVRIIWSLPSFLSKTIRTLLLMMPESLAIKPEPFGGVAEIHPGDENTQATIIRIFQDPDGRDIDFITGVTESHGKLYLGSLHNDFIGVYTLA